MDSNANNKQKGTIKLLIGATLLIAGIALIAISVIFPSTEEIVSIEATSKKVANNGKLVLATGDIESEDFEDPMFQIKSNGIFLERVVEMYQWVEHSGAYEKEWKSELVVLSSDNAKENGHSNPPEMPFFSEKWQIEESKVGAFTLSTNLAKKISSTEPVPITEQDFSKLNEHGKKAFKLHKEKYFFGVDPSAPKIGDLRVSFIRSPGGPVTILAKQQGNELIGHRSENGLIEKAMRGRRDLKTMSQGLDMGGNSTLLWVVRGGGIILVIFAMFVLLSRRSKSKLIETNDDTDLSREIEQAEKEERDSEDYNDDEAENVNTQPPEDENSNLTPESFSAEHASIQTDEDADFPPENAESFPLDTIPEQSDHMPEPLTPPDPEVASELDFSPEQSFEHTENEESLEMPAGIEMIGPDSIISEEQAEEAEPPLDEGAALPPPPPPSFNDIEFTEAASPDSFDDGEESLKMPDGIDMVGPDDDIDDEESTPPPPPILDDMPLISEEMSHEYEPPLSTSEEPLDAAEESDTEDDGGDLPPLPDFTEESNYNDTNPNTEEPTEDDSSEFVPPPPALDFPTSNESTNQDDTPDHDEDIPPLPPLPITQPSEIKDSILEEIPDLPPPIIGKPEENKPSTAEGNIDTLMDNIPDDFDPNAEMLAPESENIPDESDKFDTGDDFENTDDDQFSPFGMDENK